MEKRKRSLEKEENVFEKNRKERKYKYIGETHRSAYERGKEHIRDFKDLDEGSHLLKHYLKMHTDIKMEEMKIGMRVRSQYRSALERQVGEATSILMDQRKGTCLLNSKSEFSPDSRLGITGICLKSSERMKRRIRQLH